MRKILHIFKQPIERLVIISILIFSAANQAAESASIGAGDSIEVNESLNVRSKPDFRRSANNIVNVLSSNQQLKVLSVTTLYPSGSKAYKVQLPDGSSGWVKHSNARRNQISLIGKIAEIGDQAPSTTDDPREQPRAGGAPVIDASFYTPRPEPNEPAPVTERSTPQSPAPMTEPAEVTTQDQNNTDKPCKGVIETQRSGLNLRSLKKNRDGTIRAKGDYLCSLPSHTNFCVTSKDYDPNLSQWVEVVIPSEDFGQLPFACQRTLRHHLNYDGSYSATLKTLKDYVSHEKEDDDTEAEPPCTDCNEDEVRRGRLSTTIDAVKEMITAEPTFKEDDRMRFSKSGYTFPIDPNSSGTRITSEFGWRSRPVGNTRRRQHHNGVDFGTQGKAHTVRAAKKGKVIAVKSGCKVGDRKCGGGLGNYIKVKHADGSIAYYGHLSRTGVRVGQILDAGQAIGRVGTTGSSTGTHLDWRVKYPTWKNGKIVGYEYLNPAHLLGELYSEYKFKYKRKY